MFNKALTTKRIGITSNIVLLLIGIAYTIYAVRQPSVNRVIINNLSGMEGTDVRLIVGANVLQLDAISPGYDYEYTFVSPGDGIVKFEAVFDGQKLVCSTGYITPELGSKTEIVILSSKKIEMFSNRGYFSGSNLPVSCP